MKQRVIYITAVLLLVIGLSLLLYPTISNYINTQEYRRAIYNYVSSADEIPEEDYSALLERAQQFNAKLVNSSSAVMQLPDNMKDEYFSVLDIAGNGIIGYISIPDAEIYLPIYHGTGEAVLQSGAGHIEGSSFPVEGTSVHSVISGHRGLPSAMLFTNLDRVNIGDTFIIYVLSESYIYKVTDIETVLPTEVQSLQIEKGKNLCTLVTCTPYGINSHRLLIHGEAMDPVEAEEHLAVQSGASYVPAYQVVIIFEIPVIIIAVLISSRRTRKKR